MIKFLDIQKMNGRYESEILSAMHRVLASGWYLQGERNKEFEFDYADYIGTKHCVGCANGLDALTLIFRAYIEMGVLQLGDEVLVPANTYIASILAITENGLRAVPVEPRGDTLELDDSLLEQAITERTRALLLVHLYGRCAYTEKIKMLCQKYNLKLVEDNAQAHGCWWQGQRTGSLGNAAGHSFYPGKNLGALGDGGAVTTDDTHLADTVRALANYGSSCKYVFDYRGRNSRLDELQAAVLSVKLRCLEADNDWRRQVAAYYYRHIDNPLIKLPVRLPDEQNVYHLFPVLCERRDELQQYLSKYEVQTLIHYPIPPHLQQCYRDEWPEVHLPVTERIHCEELSLPMSPVLTDDEVKKIVELINVFK